MARKEDEETFEIHVFDEIGSKAEDVVGGEEGSLHFHNGILGDIEGCDEKTEKRRERSDYSGDEYGITLKGAPVDDGDEMSEMISAEGASPTRAPRKIKFMPKPSSDGDAYSDIMSTADKSLPSLADFSMNSEETVPINDSKFSGLKKGMDKPILRALSRSADFISETTKRTRATRNQRRTIIEDNPRYDDRIDSTSSLFIGDAQLPTAFAQLGSDMKPQIEVVDGKTRLVLELTSADSSMDLKEKLAQTLSAGLEIRSTHNQF
jgi:hypothetical protein